MWEIHMFSITIRYLFHIEHSTCTIPWKVEKLFMSTPDDYFKIHILHLTSLLIHPPPQWSVHPLCRCCQWGSYASNSLSSWVLIMLYLNWSSWTVIATTANQTFTLPTWCQEILLNWLAGMYTFLFLTPPWDHKRHCLKWNAPISILSL